MDAIVQGFQQPSLTAFFILFTQTRLVSRYSGGNAKKKVSTLKSTFLELPCPKVPLIQPHSRRGIFDFRPRSTMFSGMDFKDEGMVNFREFGGYPTSLSPNIATRNGILYRSGHLSNLTPSGWKLLHKLKISTIFCLTTTEEASSLYAKNDQSPSEIENFEIVEIPFHKTKFSRKEVLDKYIEHASRGPIVG